MVFLILKKISIRLYFREWKEAEKTEEVDQNQGKEIKPTLEDLVKEAKTSLVMKILLMLLLAFMTIAPKHHYKETILTQEYIQTMEDTDKQTLSNSLSNLCSISLTCTTKRIEKYKSINRTMLSLKL